MLTVLLAEFAEVGVDVHLASLGALTEGLADHVVRDVEFVTFVVDTRPLRHVTVRQAAWPRREKLS